MPTMNRPRRGGPTSATGGHACSSSTPAPRGCLPTAGGHGGRRRVGVDRRAPPRWVRSPRDRRLDARVPLAGVATWRRGARPSAAGHRAAARLGRSWSRARPRALTASNGRSERMMQLLQDTADGTDGHEPPLRSPCSRGRHARRVRRRGIARRFDQAAAACARSSALPSEIRSARRAARRRRRQTRAAAVVVGRLARLAGYLDPQRGRATGQPDLDDSIGVIELDGRCGERDDLPADRSGGRLRPLHARCSPMGREPPLRRAPIDLPLRRFCTRGRLACSTTAQAQYPDHRTLSRRARPGPSPA